MEFQNYEERITLLESMVDKMLKLQQGFLDQSKLHDSALIYLAETSNVAMLNIVQLWKVSPVYNSPAMSKELAQMIENAEFQSNRNLEQIKALKSQLPLLPPIPPGMRPPGS